MAFRGLLPAVSRRSLAALAAPTAARYRGGRDHGDAVPFVGLTKTLQ